MPKMGKLAAQDDYSDLDYAPYGVGSSAETANAPSGMGALASTAYNYLDDLAKRAFGASEQMRMGGTLNPAPMVEAAMLPMMGAVAGTGPGGFAMGTGPIRAYHSSPHDFDKFDLAKVGTGEGAQVYGHGLYFAENPAVSGQGGQYWNQFLSRFGETPERHAAERLRGSKFDRETAINDAKWNLDQVKDYVQHGNAPPHFKDKLLPMRQAEYDLLTSGKPVGPRTYEVDIKADPAHMLDWDKPLREQAAGARVPPEMIDQAKREAYNRALGATSKARADELWGMVKDPLQAPGGFMIDAGKKFRGPETSAALEKAGIPGIKYLDEGSRGVWDVRENPKGFRGQQTVSPGYGGAISEYFPTREAAQDWISKARTSNYVIFDPNIIDIMRKYGIAGAAPIGALAAQDNYQPEEKM